MTKDEIVKLLNEISESVAVGLGWSGIWALIIPEVIHAVSVIITGLIGATVIFFYNRFLKKRYP